MADESRNTPAQTGSSFKFDVKRWSQTDRIVAIATLVLFVSLFLSWFGAGIYVYNVTVDGLWHGYMYITLIVSLAIMGYLALVAGMETLPFKLPASHAQLLLVATGLNFVLTLISVPDQTERHVVAVRRVHRPHRRVHRRGSSCCSRHSRTREDKAIAQYAAQKIRAFAMPHDTGPASQENGVRAGR